jgi:hypothetical protein
LIEKHLQDHEETLIHTLVVNLPIAYSTTLPRNNPPRSCATLQETRTRQELKISLPNESKLCYDPKEGKTSSIYTIL